MSRFDADVLIVGAGLSGCLAAAGLIRAGLDVVLVDSSAAPADEFRAEQIVGGQIQKLRALGVLDTMTAGSRPSNETVNARRGRVLDRTRVEQYGVSYRTMVTGVRANLPRERLLKGRVVGLETSSGTQTVHLADGRTLSVRLVIVATGLLDHVLKTLGITREVISASHSLCVGFDLEIEADGAGAMPLIYYADRPKDRIDYLALFPLAQTLRANLFCYQDKFGEWARDFTMQPNDRMHALLPGLRHLIGRTRVISAVQMRDNDVSVARNVVRDGVVLIGDAFQTPCPAAGTGIDRILSDLEVLQRMLPSWLAQPMIASSHIAQFYTDPIKRAFDAECIRIALYRRAVSTQTGWKWSLHRHQVFLRRRLRAILADRGGVGSNVNEEAAMSLTSAGS